MSDVTDTNPDDLVEQWHRTPDEKRPFTKFMADRLGWSEADVKKWVETGKEPRAGLTRADRATMEPPNQGRRDGKPQSV